MSDDAHPPEIQAPPGLVALFLGFFQAGMLGFGGVLTIARRIFVEDRHWLTPAQFTDLFSLCQFLPGANIVNFAFAFGARHRGVAGAASAVTGLLAAPMAIVLGLGALYARYGGLPLARHGLAGLAAAATGLVLATAAKIAQPTFTSPRNIAVSVLAFALVMVAHLSLPATMALVLPLALFLAWAR